MLILGITTSTQQVGCAIGGHEGVLASVHSSRGKRHAETLTPAIEFITRQARVDLAEISAVAVDVGPGLFTGLRVGVATAKAMAFALRVPMVGVVSLDLLAFTVRHSPRMIHAVLDGRRSEVFAASYRQVPGGVQRLSEPSVAHPRRPRLRSRRRQTRNACWSATEPSATATSSRAFARRHRRTRPGHPNAGALVQLAHARAVREDFVNNWEVEPLYLRPPDAEINWEQRSRT